MRQPKRLTKDIHYGILEPKKYFLSKFSSVQLLSRVQLFVTPWIAAHQASLSITIPRSSLRLTSIESVMPSSHLILCHPLLLLPPIPPGIRVFSSESSLRMRWPKYWVSALASFLPKKSQGWSPSEWTGWISLQSKGLSRVLSNTTVQKHQCLGAQPSSQSNSHIHTWPLEKPEFWLYGPLSAKWCLRFLIGFLVASEGDQPRDFFGGNDAEAETPVLWPPHVKSWLIGKDWCWEGLGAGGEGDDRGWDGWMASLTRWTWV